MSLHNSNYQMNTWNNNNHLRYVAMQEYLFIFKKNLTISFHAFAY